MYLVISWYANGWIRRENYANSTSSSKESKISTRLNRHCDVASELAKSLNCAFSLLSKLTIFKEDKVSMQGNETIPNPSFNIETHCQPANILKFYTT